MIILASVMIGGGTSTAAAKNQLEQLTTMREALFSQDGWGCQHVNQGNNQYLILIFNYSNELNSLVKF